MVKANNVWRLRKFEKETIAIWSSSRRLWQFKLYLSIRILKNYNCNYKFVACLGGFCLGCCLGWNSPIAELLRLKYGFPTLQRNLIGAALPLGCLLGVIVVPFFVDRIGRKNTMLAVVPPFVFGWLLIIFAYSNVYMYITGRFITGFFSGMFCVLTPMYCAEISEKEIRGIFKFN